MKKIVNGVIIEMTAEEIEEIDAWRNIPLETLKEQKKSENAAKRYEKETSGVEYNGHLISTDREDWKTMDSNMEKIRRGLVTEIEWKCGDGSYLTLMADNISEIEILILTHIQGSFAKEKYFNGLIDNATTKEQLDSINIKY